MRTTHKRRLIIRRFIIGATAILCVLIGYAYHWKWSRRPIRSDYTTQRPGEARRTWRVMRAAWKFQPGPPGAPWVVNDLFGNDDNLYYVSDCEAGCLDPDSGKTRWRFPFVSTDTARGGQQNAQSGRSWRLFPDTDRLYACESGNGSAVSYEAFHLYALNSRTGKVEWGTQFLTPFAGQLCVAGALLLLTDIDGTIKALRRADGALVWQQRLTARRYPWKGDYAPLFLSVEGGYGILQVGAGHILVFRVGDGSLVWSLPAKPKAARAAEEGYPNTFVVDKGIVYTLLANNTMIAFTLSTGQRLWTRHSTCSVSQAGYLSGAQGRVICEASATLVGLDTQKGKTAWVTDVDSNGSAANMLTETTLARESQAQNILPVSHSILYMQINCEALVEREQHLLKSVTSMTTLLAIDAATGQERWRWQPIRDMSFDKIVTGRQRLYISEGAVVTAIEDGAEDPLPDTTYGRGRLTRRLLYQQYNWPPPEADPLQLWMRLVAPVTMRGIRNRDGTTGGASGNTAGNRGGNVVFVQSDQSEQSDQDEAELAIMEMGADSVPSLLEFITHAVSEEAKTPLPAGMSNQRRNLPAGFTNVLDLLFDKEDSRVVPALMELLKQTDYPGTRMALAEALVRCGDVRALRTLFRYAQSPSDSPSTSSSTVSTSSAIASIASTSSSTDPASPEAREDALYYVCRHSVPPHRSPLSAGLPSDAPTQQEVTAWLMHCLADRKTPSWLYLFAKFELLHDRGDGPRQAALSTFHHEREARFLPAGLVLHSAYNNPVMKRQVKSRFSIRPVLLRQRGMIPVLYREFPREIAPRATVREASGRIWATFVCHYLGHGEELWFAQSHDTEKSAAEIIDTNENKTEKTIKTVKSKAGQSNKQSNIRDGTVSGLPAPITGKEKQRRGMNWRKPAFGINLSVRCLHEGNPDTMTLTCSNGILHLTWEEIIKPPETRTSRQNYNLPTPALQRFLHREDIAIADIYRDSDGDGITDLVEKELGLDPHRADTNGNGIPDGRDKNPLYKQHRLTEQEKIYQAVLDALCQLGRSLPARTESLDEGDTPTPFGRTSGPLNLPSPPGSVGVEVLGHTGMVLCRPQRLFWTAHESLNTRMADMESFHFSAPHIGLDGTWHGHGNQEAQGPTTPIDPFAASKTDKKASAIPFDFKYYFPVVISQNGTRARIGFSPDQSPYQDSQRGFDIEVRKIGGRWLPVECRLVYRMGRRVAIAAVVPVRSHQDKIQLEYSGRAGY